MIHKSTFSSPLSSIFLSRLKKRFMLHEMGFRARFAPNINSFQRARRNCSSAPAKNYRLPNEKCPLYPPRFFPEHYLKSTIPPRFPFLISAIRRRKVISQSTMQGDDSFVIPRYFSPARSECSTHLSFRSRGTELELFWEQFWNNSGPGGVFPEPFVILIVLCMGEKPAKVSQQREE